MVGAVVTAVVDTAVAVAVAAMGAGVATATRAGNGSSMVVARGMEVVEDTAAVVAAMADLGVVAANLGTLTTLEKH